MHDSRTARRLFSGACLIVGPALAFLGIVVRPDGSDDTGKELLAVVAASRSAVLASDVLFIAAILLLVPALVGAIHLLRNRAPILGYLGGGLAIAGYVCLISRVALDSVALEMVGRGTTGADMAAVLDRTMNQDLLFVLLTIVFVAGHIVGTTLLGIGFWRAHSIPVWAAAAVTVSQPLHFIAHGIENKPLDVVAFALFAAGMAMLGVRVLRMLDAAWEAEPADAGWSALQAATLKKREAMAR
jgi:hypothetical protein